MHTAIVCENMSINMDCVPMCGWANCPPLYSRYTSDKLGDIAQGAKIFSAITGVDMTHDEMMKAMDPVYFNIERCIHIKKDAEKNTIYTPNLYTT